MFRIFARFPLETDEIGSRTFGNSEIGQISFKNNSRTMKMTPFQIFNDETRTLSKFDTRPAGAGFYLQVC